MPNQFVMCDENEYYHYVPNLLWDLRYLRKFENCEVV